MQWFTVTGPSWVLDQMIELPGWSHQKNVRDERICCYPWVEQVADFVVQAKHKRELCKQLSQVLPNPNIMRIQ